MRLGCGKILTSSPRSSLCRTLFSGPVALATHRKQHEEMICPTHQSMRSMWSTCFCFSSYRERISTRRIHGYLGGIEAGRSEVREAGECSAATVGHGASGNEALRWYEWQWQ